MNLINEKSFDAVERPLKMDSSSPSKPVLCVGVCEAGMCKAQLVYCIGDVR